MYILTLSCIVFQHDCRCKARTIEGTVRHLGLPGCYIPSEEEGFGLEASRALRDSRVVLVAGTGDFVISSRLRASEILTVGMGTGMGSGRSAMVPAYDPCGYVTCTYMYMYAQLSEIETGLELNGVELPALANSEAWKIPIDHSLTTALSHSHSHRITVQGCARIW
jgi:hypothetical protein